jgi:hypothetical protein
MQIQIKIIFNLSSFAELLSLEVGFLTINILIVLDGVDYKLIITRSPEPLGFFVEKQTLNINVSTLTRNIAINPN